MDRRGFIFGTFAASFAPCWPVAPTIAFSTPEFLPIAEGWFHSGEYLDLSIAENRRKFIDAAGKPINYE